MNDSSVSRREFLNYIWAASIAVFMAGNGIVAFLFAWPRKPIQSVLIEAALLPASGSAPTTMPTNTLPNPYRQMGGIQLTTGPGHVFLAHLAEGLVTLDVRCTHQGCVMPFSESARRFDCPCHGAQFTLNGTYLLAPHRAIWIAMAGRRWTHTGMSSRYRMVVPRCRCRQIPLVFRFGRMKSSTAKPPTFNDRHRPRRFQKPPRSCWLTPAAPRWKWRSCPGAAWGRSRPATPR